jgi:hypothetical protein
MSTTTTTLVRERIGRQVGDSRALGRRSLPLAVLASVIGTMLASAYGTDRVGTLLTAATAPVLTALFTTRGRIWARSVGIVVVTSIAVGLTVTGFTVPELVLGGKALIAHRHGTFMPTEGSSGSSGTSGGEDTPDPFTSSPSPTDTAPTDPGTIDPQPSDLGSIDPQPTDPPPMPTDPPPMPTDPAPMPTDPQPIDP